MGILNVIGTPGASDVFTLTKEGEKFHATVIRERVASATSPRLEVTWTCGQEGILATAPAVDGNKRLSSCIAIWQAESEANSNKGKICMVYCKPYGQCIGIVLTEVNEQFSQVISSAANLLKNYPFPKSIAEQVEKLSISFNSH